MHAINTVMTVNCSDDKKINKASVAVSVWNNDNNSYKGPPPQASCGKSPNSRVIGGVDAKPGNWPWQVSRNFQVALCYYLLHTNVLLQNTPLVKFIQNYKT